MTNQSNGSSALFEICSCKGVLIRHQVFEGRTKAGIEDFNPCVLVRCWWPMSDEEDNGLREREASLCPCKSRMNYATCCMPFHYGTAKPGTAEQLMRSRYSAYFFRRIDYLVDTTHPDTREPGLRKHLEKTVYQANWANLSIIATAKGGKEDKVGKVEFVANYFVNGEPYELHEVSRFKRSKGQWKYLDGKE